MTVADLIAKRAELTEQIGALKQEREELQGRVERLVVKWEKAYNRYGTSDYQRGGYCTACYPVWRGTVQDGDVVVTFDCTYCGSDSGSLRVPITYIDAHLGDS